MNSFLNPLLGGILIGVAATIMLASLGRICGISGIASGLLDRPSSENYWKFSFVAGLIIGGFILKFQLPQFFEYELKFTYQEAIIAGLLVGFGTRFGGGCTSGHGVCGLPRLASRSILATATFIICAVITVYVRGQL